MPGDPTDYARAGPEEERHIQVSRGRYEEMRRAFGLDRHWTLAYLEWAGKFVRGDLGNSLHRHTPVSGMIAERLPATLLLSGVSIGIAFLAAILLGLYSARREGKPDEKALSALLYLGYSFPSYVAAILGVLVFAVTLRILPVSGMRSPDHEELSAAGKLWDIARHMVLPVSCYSLGYIAYYTRFLRASLLSAMRSDFVRAARAKGLPETAVLVKHGLRNSLVPLVTLLGLSLPALVGGSVILEQIFAWPGMGRLFFEGLYTRDYPLIMGLTMMFSALIIAGSLCADLLYAAVDPRIRYGS
jgi:peptide/nickel transport system permease protein